MAKKILWVTGYLLAGIAIFTPELGLDNTVDNPVRMMSAAISSIIIFAGYLWFL